MLKKIVARLLLLMLFAVAGQAQSSGVRQLAPGVYLWPGDRDRRQPANCTWVVFKDYVVVLDANFPWGAREILTKIRTTTDKPIRYVFNTHYHGDHSYGNSVFVDRGAAVITSQATDKELRTRGAAGWTNWRDTAHSLEGARLEPASITFTDQMVLDDGTQRVELIRMGPSHSNGDAVAYLPKQKILIAGDLCVTWGFGNNVADASANYDNWLHGLERMAAWGVTTVVPGHGAVGSVEVLKVQREYLADMVYGVRSGIAAGKSADELVREIDLRKHGLIANDADANAVSIRAVYRHLTAK
ncbi:MAG TPA: MBL fold metallo-hydrolase [Bryobacteraceae bacterium]|nr:MBL fold metallo-hydrolase [Bryobacteraceae bacterium]